MIATRLTRVQPRILRALYRSASWFFKGRLPQLVSVACVVEDDERVLTILRHDGLGYCLPGGLVRADETAEEALVREVFEETGYSVEPTGLLTVRSEPDRDPRFGCVCIVYTGSIRGGTGRNSNEGKVTWLDSAHLPLEMAFDTAAILLDYRSGTA